MRMQLMLTKILQKIVIHYQYYLFWSVIIMIHRFETSPKLVFMAVSCFTKLPVVSRAGNFFFHFGFLVLKMQYLKAVGNPHYNIFMQKLIFYY